MNPWKLSCVQITEHQVTEKDISKQNGNLGQYTSNSFDISQWNLHISYTKVAPIKYQKGDKSYEYQGLFSSGMDQDSYPPESPIPQTKVAILSPYQSFRSCL